MVTLTKSRMSKSCILPGCKDAEGSSRPHFSSSDLSRGNFSWSFVMRIALLSANHHSASSSSSSSSSSTSQCSGRCCRSDYVSRSSNNSSFARWYREGHTTSFISRSLLRRPSARRKSRRKPALLEKVPFGKSAKYMTVYVGMSTEQSVRYVISRRLVTHPLFKVLLKCSEDEFGEEYAVNDGVAIICDPALFVELVRAIDNNLWSA